VFFGQKTQKNKCNDKTEAINQSLRPSGFTPAFGRKVAASRLVLDAGLKPRSTQKQRQQQKQQQLQSQKQRQLQQQRQ